MHEEPHTRFHPVPLLEGERLVLRRISNEDVADIAEITAYDGVIAQNVAEALRFLDRIDRDAARGETLHWGICPRDVLEMVGTCGFYRGFRNRTGEVGYILRPAHRGRGLMTEAVRLVTDFGFKHLKLERVIAVTTPENTASIAVLERVGLQVLEERDGRIAFFADAPGPSEPT